MGCCVCLHKTAGKMIFVSILFVMCGLSEGVVSESACSISCVKSVHSAFL